MTTTVVNVKPNVGRVAVARDYYPTPPDVAETMTDLVGPFSGFPRGGRILEPSAGTGALVRAVLDAIEADDGPLEDAGLALAVDAIEASPELCEGLRATFDGEPVSVHCADFITWTPPGPDSAPYKLVVMNPPFNAPNRDAYIRHIWRAWTMLADDGLLVAVTPSSWGWRSGKEVFPADDWRATCPLTPAQFRAFVARWGGWRDVRKDAFGVTVRLVVLGKSFRTWGQFFPDYDGYGDLNTARLSLAIHNTLRRASSSRTRPDFWGARGVT